MKKEFLRNIFSFIILLGFSGVAEALGRKSKFENMSFSDSDHGSRCELCGG
jgi:hypothetical protein